MEYTNFVNTEKRGNTYNQTSRKLKKSPSGNKYTIGDNGITSLSGATKNTSKTRQ